MSSPHIAILGDGVESWLFAALFWQLSRHTGTLHLIPSPRWQGTGSIALPPVIARAHQLLQIPPATLAAIGRPRHGIRVAAVKAETLIPYGSYGDPEAPANLADTWIRLRSAGSAPDLASLSVNRVLMSGGQINPKADTRLLNSIETGWEIDATGYRSMLKEAALSRGVLCASPLADMDQLASEGSTVRLADGTMLEADLFVDASEDHFSLLPDGAGWDGRILAVGSAARRMGTNEPFEIAAILSAAARVATLLPRTGAIPLLAREYNRLLETELAGMDAAAAMLERLAGRAGPSATLDRYATRYRLEGLLPADPQPWSRDIWLSAFDAAGWRPQHYDPNIDRVDSDRSTRRFDDWRALMDRYLQP